MFTRAGSVKVARAVASVRPRSVDALDGWLRAVLGVEVPRRGRCAGHAAPMDYLAHAFFERPGDAVVWGNRGGGKTFYGAVATLLDLLFKPGVEVRILGGGFEQSRRMHGYLRWMLERPALRAMIDGRITRRGVSLRNGSRVELLAQSQTSVRGHRVQKLRCDEVDLFDREVWAAAQFVTRSATCGGVAVRGTIEALSTMHRPYGLMSEIVAGAGPNEDGRGGKGGSGAAGGVRAPRANPPWKLFHWCAMDVMARCEPDRSCGRCPLWSPCGGAAKGFRGFLAVADVAAQRERSSRARFESEMLCRRPSRADAVYPEFDPAAHVAEVGAGGSNAWVGGMDFGMRSPFVMLWARWGRGAGGRDRLEVVDEYVRSDRSMSEHLAVIEGRGLPRPAWVGVDPAGGQRSHQTGRSTIAMLGEAGYRVRARRQPLLDGIEAVRRLLDGGRGAPERGPAEAGGAEHGAGPDGGGDGFDPGDPGGAGPAPAPGLVIHPRCVNLIESLTCYHFDADRPRKERPVKDGYDHAADALRYLVINLPRRGAVAVRTY